MYEYYNEEDELLLRLHFFNDESMIRLRWKDDGEGSFEPENDYFDFEDYEELKKDLLNYHPILKSIIRDKKLENILNTI